MFDSGNKLKGYIQKEAKEKQIHSNYGYNYYFSRYFLDKLYNDPKTNFILKGSYSQFCSLEKITRPLTDIDIVTFNRVQDAKDGIDEIINTKDSVKFKIVSQHTTTNATLNYKILCDFDGKTSRISIDLKREDMLDVERVSLPTFFSKDEVFDVNSSSINEHLASKLYVVLLHLKLNNVLSRNFRRYKDFYDIYQILASGIIDEGKVMEILARKIRNDEFLNDYELDGPLFQKKFITDNQEKWNNDKNKLEFLNDISFEESVETTNNFISRRR